MYILDPSLSKIEITLIDYLNPEIDQSYRDLPAEYCRRLFLSDMSPKNAFAEAVQLMVSKHTVSYSDGKSVILDGPWIKEINKYANSKAFLEAIEDLNFSTRMASPTDDTFAWALQTLKRAVNILDVQMDLKINDKKPQADWECTPVRRKHIDAILAPIIYTFKSASLIKAPPKEVAGL